MMMVGVVLPTTRGLWILSRETSEYYITQPHTFRPTLLQPYPPS